VADPSERPVAVTAPERVCGVLDDHETVSLGDLHDRLHLAADAAVVHDEDRPGAWGDRALDEGLVHVEGIGADVHEHGHGPSEHERVGRGGERVGRHDDLVARSEAGQDRRHLQSRRGRLREEHLAAEDLLQQPWHCFVNQPLPDR
jgi:hypothetical protein